MGRSYIRNVGTNGIYNEDEEFMAGQIVFVAGTVIPNGYLECNGATVSRTTYATLFAAIGSTYGAGDGATTFKVPDLRGEFLRGADRGRGVDSGRAVGSAQAATRVSGNPVVSGVSLPVSNQVIDADAPSEAMGTLNVVGSAASTSVIYGNRVRPRNVAMIPCIKYS